MWVLPAILLLAAASADVSVKSLDNSTQSGRLVSLDSQQVVIETDGERKTLLLEELIGLNMTSAPAASTETPSAWVQLDDGSLLMAQNYAVAGGTVRSQLLGGGQFEAKSTAVRWVRLKQQTEEQAAEWAKVIKADVGGDLIVIRKNERIDYLEGVVGDITADVVNFRLDSEWVPVRRERVEGVVYFNANRIAPPASAGVVHDAAGSHLNAVDLALADDGLTITIANGVKLVRPLDTIRQIDFSAGKIQYLSELEPRLIEWTPFFSPVADDPQLAALYQPRMNLPISNDTIRGDEALLQLRKTNDDGVPEIHTYTKGIALHSRTRITWQLPDSFSSLKALAGIDARYRNLGDVELVIEGDGKELFRADISGRDEPLPLDIDLTGVRRLTILVDFGKNLDIGDHLNLCNARVVK